MEKSISDPIAGYSLNKHYTRLTVWRFGADHRLHCTLKYSYTPPKGERRFTRRERYDMFCEYLGHNGLALPEYVETTHK